MNSTIQLRDTFNVQKGIPLLIAVVAVGSRLFAQGTFESATGVRYRTEMVVTGLLQPSAMVFLPDGRALLIERRNGKVDLLDVKSGAIIALDGGFAPLIGRDTGAHDPAPACAHRRRRWSARHCSASQLFEQWLDLYQLLVRRPGAQHHGG